MSKLPAKVDRLRIDRLSNGFYIQQMIGDGSASGPDRLDTVEEVIALDDDDVLIKIKEWLQGSAL